MLVNEVSRIYEEEKEQTRMKHKKKLIDKEKSIQNLKNEAKVLTDQVLELQKQVFSEADRFAQLNETYLILKHHNEEGLALRLQTEERLKSLFQRDKNYREVFRRTEVDRQIYNAEALESEKKLEELSLQVTSLEGLLREKEGLQKIKQNEMTAQKRIAFQATSRVK